MPSLSWARAWHTLCTDQSKAGQLSRPFTKSLWMYMKTNPMNVPCSDIEVRSSRNWDHASKVRDGPIQKTHARFSLFAGLSHPSCYSSLCRLGSPHSCASEQLKYNTMHWFRGPTLSTNDQVQVATVKIKSSRYYKKAAHLALRDVPTPASYECYSSYLFLLFRSEPHDCRHGQHLILFLGHPFSNDRHPGQFKYVVLILVEFSPRTSQATRL